MCKLNALNVIEMFVQLELLTQPKILTPSLSRRTHCCDGWLISFQGTNISYILISSLAWELSPNKLKLFNQDGNQMNFI